MSYLTHLHAMFWKIAVTAYNIIGDNKFPKLWTRIDSES